MRKLLLAIGLASLVLPGTAEAHFNLTMPPAMANSTEGGKGDAPCGPDTQAKAATATVTAVTGGSALVLNIDEWVPHPGFYRFAISTTTPPTFPADNVVLDSNDMVIGPTSKSISAKGIVSNPVVFPVIADGMFTHLEKNPPVQSFPKDIPGTVVVPNMNCEKCTLQVIEYMNNHGSNGDSAGFFYHHCALLKITADPNKPIFDPSNPNGSGGAAGAGGSGGAPAAAGASGAAGSAAGSGTGGASSGAGGAPQGVAGTAVAGASPSAGASSGGASSAGAATSIAGAPATAPADPGDDSGGCSLSHRAVGSLPALSLLLGLFALGRRRDRRG